MTGGHGQDSDGEKGTQNLEARQASYLRHPARSWPGGVVKIPVRRYGTLIETSPRHRRHDRQQPQESAGRAVALHPPQRTANTETAQPATSRKPDTASRSQPGPQPPPTPRPAPPPPPSRRAPALKEDTRSPPRLNRHPGGTIRHRSAQPHGTGTGTGRRHPARSRPATATRPRRRPPAPPPEKRVGCSRTHRSPAANKDTHRSQPKPDGGSRRRISGGACVLSVLFLNQRVYAFRLRVFFMVFVLAVKAGANRRKV